MEQSKRASFIEISQNEMDSSSGGAQNQEEHSNSTMPPAMRRHSDPHERVFLTRDAKMIPLANFLCWPERLLN